MIRKTKAYLPEVEAEKSRKKKQKKKEGKKA